MAKTNDFYPVDDRQLMHTPGSPYEPLYMVRRAGCYASILLVALTWLATIAVMVWQEWPLTWWPFVALPAALWVGLLALPMFVKFRASALTTLDAMAKTSEAYLARAGWSVDINSDGVIGHRVPVVRPPVEEYRPLIVHGRVADETHKSLPAPAPGFGDVARDAVGGGDQLPAADPVKVKVWHLPNGERIEQGELESFVDGVFVVGWSRDVWLQQGMRREVYEGAVMLLEQGQVIVDRKTGFAGRLNVRNASQARRVLDLPTS